MGATSELLTQITTICIVIVVVSEPVTVFCRLCSFLKLHEGKWHNGIYSHT